MAYTANTNAAPPKKRRSVALWLIPLLICIFALFFLCSCCSFLGLSLIGAKGQPSTIISSTKAAEGVTAPIPEGLTASPAEDSINLKWAKAVDESVKEYHVYRSEKPGQGYGQIGTVEAATAAYVDPANFGDDVYNPQAEIKLEKGQQWIEKGKLLITADPPDPEPYQAVTITIKLFNAKEGIVISYTVNGTDGYHRSEQATTDSSGEVKFTIAGGAAGVQDTVEVSVPSENLQGSVQYTF